MPLFPAQIRAWTLPPVLYLPFSWPPARQVQVGSPGCLPLCYMGMTVKTEAVVCLHLSAPLISSTHSLLGDPHKACQTVLGVLSGCWKWGFTECLMQMTVLGAWVKTCQSRV